MKVRWVMRLKLVIVCILCSCSILTCLCPIHALGTSPTTTYYAITGELCYNEGGFSGNYPVSGTLGVKLTSLTPETVRCERWGYIQEGSSSSVIGESVLVEDRQEPNGNYTLFFLDFSANATLRIGTMTKDVVAHYIGERYVKVGDTSVRTRHYCYVVNEVQSILRFEWDFEAMSGVLLKFSKSIEINFVRVQWEEYVVKNSTLTLTSAHPVAAFFTNFQENFYAGTGALIGILLLFYVLTQKKLQRSPIL